MTKSNELHGNHERTQGSFGKLVAHIVSVPIVGSLLFGILSAALLLTTGTITAMTSARGFFWALVAVVSGGLFARWKTGKLSDKKPRWGPVSVLVLGFGLGSLFHHYKEWIKWLWATYSRINEPWELIMEGLFLFGVILGFFVVRNWSKDQKDFLGSLTAVLGGAVLSTALGPLTKSVDSIQSFAYYFLGFAMSGSLNLIAASWLMANYSNKPSVTNRALLDFLYGADKAEAIDKQFLKNFEKDPIYARKLLVEALDHYKEKVLQEFARKMEAKRKAQTNLRYYLLNSIEGPTKHSLGTSDTQLPVLAEGPAVDIEEKPFTVNIRKLEDNEQISPEMFRMSISVKYQEYLEYIGRDAGGWKSFPLLGSVAGLALLAGQTVVMDRDKNTRFRTRENLDGICPIDVEQQRGLNEITYLSYISIPVMTELGNYRETPLGIISVSTKLFAALQETDTEITKQDTGNYHRIKVRLSSLTDMAKRIYDQSDECVSYLEGMRTVAVPLLELYLRCRQGAT